MRNAVAQTIAAGLLAVIGNVVCSHAAISQDAVKHAQASEAEKKTVHQPTPEQQAAGIRQAYSDADIDFMTGMIPHHAQAVIMAGWAPSPGARADNALLCERVLFGPTHQNRAVQQGLSERGPSVPAGEAPRMKKKKKGVRHEIRIHR